MIVSSWSACLNYPFLWSILFMHSRERNMEGFHRIAYKCLVLVGMPLERKHGDEINEIYIWRGRTRRNWRGRIWRRRMVTFVQKFFIPFFCLFRSTMYKWIFWPDKMYSISACEIIKSFTCCHFGIKSRDKTRSWEQLSDQGVATSLLKALLTSFSAGVSQSKSGLPFWLNFDS